MDHTDSHKKTYDSLAEEYESRADALLAVTEEGVSNFTAHIKTGRKVLDVGCGVGLAINLLQKKGFFVTGVELSPKMVEFAKKRTPESNIIEGDFLKIDFTEKFDGILAFAFIHLFPKDEAMKVLSKMHGMLRPGGILYIGTTESKESREGLEEKKDYQNLEKRFRKHWTEKELEMALRASGFRLIELHKIPDPFGKVWMDFVVERI